MKNLPVALQAGHPVGLANIVTPILFSGNCGRKRQKLKAIHPILSSAKLRLPWLLLPNVQEVLANTLGVVTLFRLEVHWIAGGYPDAQFDGGSFYRTT